MYGDEALMYDPDPDETQRERILRAAAACPVQAIALERPTAGRARPGLTCASVRTGSNAAVAS
jgi:hypothetical protein